MNQSVTCHLTVRFASTEAQETDKLPGASVAAPSVVHAGLRGYKTSFFILKSVEHEFLNTHKYKDIKKFGFFLGSDKPRMLFSCS